MATIRNLIIDALEKKYESDISKADATIKIYLENPVGIGEHPEIVQAIEMEIGKMAEAQDKLDTVNQLLNIEDKEFIVE